MTGCDDSLFEVNILVPVVAIVTAASEEDAQNQVLRHGFQMTHAEDLQWASGLPEVVQIRELEPSNGHRATAP